MRVLYLGPNVSTSALRVAAFRRAGHEVRAINPAGLLPDWRWMGAWVWHAGALGVDHLAERRLFRALRAERYDVVFVDPGNVVSRNAVRRLHRHADIVINYNLDNPFSGRDGLRWRAANGAIPEYDLMITPRTSCIEAAYHRGARRIIRMYQTADEIRDRPRELTASEKQRFSAEVCFVGTWMPGRGAFLAELIAKGVPLKIYGTAWSKAPEYMTLRDNLQEGHLGGADYSAALLGAKIVLGMLSGGNEDLHTTRSIEAPAMGAVFCAPRTSDHLELYDDGREAVFYDSAADCARKCLMLLADPVRRAEMGRAARARAVTNGNFNQTILERALAAMRAKSDDQWAMEARAARTRLS